MNFPKIEFATGSGKADGLVLGWFQEELSEKEKSSQPALQYLGKKHKEIDSLLALLRQSKHFYGKKAETSFLRFFPFSNYPNVLIVGAGPQKKFSSEICRQVGAAINLAQRKERLPRLAVQMDSIFSASGKTSAYDIQAFCEGYLLAGYEFRDLKKADPELFTPQALELVGTKDAAAVKGIESAQIMARGVTFARRLGDQPGNVLTPTEFAKQVSKMAKETGLKCTVWGRSEIEREKMGLFWGVAKGSAEEPRFIILEHRGGKKSDRPVVLVGKGITFDSGGISIKPAARMEDMKYDMMGAAAVAGIALTAAELDLPLNLTFFIAACENMPGGKAQKPGDVARSRSGKTVEIINTDAEGRLILADALDYAQTTNPQAILDFATLTGAVIDALGTVTAGIMGNHSELIERMKTASKVTGERVWELPLYDEYLEDLKSNVADIKNSGVREAGSSKGGTFLKYFIDPKFPWVHCDIAGVAYQRKDANYHPQRYGSGVMVRLISELLMRWEPLKS